MTGYLHAPRHVAACDLGHATVVVNYRSGRVHTLIGAAARWWAQLAATGDPSAATALPKATAESVAAQLRQAGTLVERDSARPWPDPLAGKLWTPSWGVHEVPFALAPIPHVPTGRLILAAGALTATLAVQHAGPANMRMARLTGLLMALTRCRRRPASPYDVRTAVNAVRRASLLSPVRVACLEESVAAVAVLAAAGKGARWCHGVAADPIRLHAWVETLDGTAEAEPPATRSYTAMRIIPDRKEPITP